MIMEGKVSKTSLGLCKRKTTPNFTLEFYFYFVKFVFVFFLFYFYFFKLKIPNH